MTVHKNQLLLRASYQSHSAISISYYRGKGQNEHDVFVDVYVVLSKMYDISIVHSSSTVLRQQYSTVSAFWKRSVPHYSIQFV